FEQIIIATHSPFILSDLTNSHANFIKRKGNFCTVLPRSGKNLVFAANIHILLSDSFFLQYGLIGEFAKAKIHKMISQLQSSGNLSELEEIKATIKNIGEPILKIKLTEMLAEKLGEDSEIARLKAQQE